MASGGGTQDHSIILWNTAGGGYRSSATMKLQRLDIGSQVCQICWVHEKAFKDRKEHSRTDVANPFQDSDYTPCKDSYQLVVAEGYSSAKISMFKLAPFLHSCLSFLPHGPDHRPLQMGILEEGNASSSSSSLVTCSSDENLKFWKLKDLS